MWQGFVRIGRGAFERTQHNGGVSDAFSHRAGRVLIGRYRNNPIAVG